jgi:hypothetical protein
MLSFPVVAASIWSALVVEVVLETVRTEARALVAFGRVLADPPLDATILMLCALSASAALAMVTAVARARGRRLERRMAAELDARYAELAERDAGDSARRLLTWRLAELQTLVDRLLEERRAVLSDGGGAGKHQRHLVVVPDVSDGHDVSDARGNVDLDLDLPVGPSS